MSMLLFGLVVGIPLLRLIGAGIGFVLSFGLTLVSLGLRFLTRRAIAGFRHRRLLRA